MIALNAIWAHFLGAFSPNIIPPKYAEQDQIDAKWLKKKKKKKSSNVRVEE